jgi:hypothetical protein
LSHFACGYLLVVIDLPQYETVALFTLDTGSRWRKLIANASEAVAEVLLPEPYGRWLLSSVG